MKIEDHRRVGWTKWRREDGVFVNIEHFGGKNEYIL